MNSINHKLATSNFSNRMKQFYHIAAFACVVMVLAGLIVEFGILSTLAFLAVMLIVVLGGSYLYDLIAKDQRSDVP